MLPSRVAAALILVVSLGGTTSARAAEILVHAAASLTESLREIAKAHEAETGVNVLLDFGASSTLARQIVEGAPGDVFFSADEAQMDRVAKAGHVVADTRRSLLSNALVVVVANGSKLPVTFSGDLAKPVVKSVALADPAAAPAGIYAKSHLRRIGIWGKVAGKVVPTENVRGALAAVESGNVDVALVYKTDALVSSRVRVAAEVPKDQVDDISYPVAVLAGAADPVEARAFVDRLASPEARAVFEAHGFIVR